MDKQAAHDILLYKEQGALTGIVLHTKKDIPKEKAGIDCFIINTNGNEQETRRIVDALKGQTHATIAVYGAQGTFNRRVIETMKIHYLIDPEREAYKDSLKQRDSAFNHVVARVAQKRGIAIVLNVTALQKLAKKEQAQRIARIMQNIKVARKAGCEIKIASFADKTAAALSKEARQNLLLSFGASTNQVRNATTF